MVFFLAAVTCRPLTAMAPDCSDTMSDISRDGLEEWIASLMECKPLTEAQVKQLCDKVRRSLCPSPFCWGGLEQPKNPPTSLTLFVGEARPVPRRLLPCSRLCYDYVRVRLVCCVP